MKKLLALVLALVMTMSLVTISNAAFKDADKIDYDEAVEVMNAIGVLVGDEKGNFNAKENLTREQAAKIISYLLLGNKTAEALVGAAKFTDVAATRWSAGFVDYCASTGVVAGNGDGTFAPAGQLTGFQFAKMLLVALGYDAKIEGFTGTDWQINVSKVANQVGLFNGLSISGTAVLTREQAAQMCLNTLKAPLVEYSNKGGSLSVNGAVINIGASKAQYVTTTLAKEQRINNRTLTNTDTTLNGGYTVEFGEKYYPALELKNDETDVFGRPSHKWLINNKKIDSYVDYDLLVKEYTAEVTGKDLYDLLGSNAIKESEVNIYIDGETEKGILDSAYFTAGNLVKTNTKTVGATGNGVLTQVFQDTDAKEITIVIINTYLAKADGDYSEKQDKAELTVYSINDANSSANVEQYVKADNTESMEVKGEDFGAIVEDMKEDDIVLVTVANGEIQTIAEPKTISDTEISSFKDGSYLTVDGTKYEFGSTLKFNSKLIDYTGINSQINLKDTTYNVYLDQYGYVVGIDEVSSTTNYVFVTGYDSNFSNLTAKTADVGAIFTDGTMKVIEVKVKDSKDAAGDPFFKVADKPATKNTWCTYTVDKNGVYTLKEVATYAANKVGQYSDTDYTTTIDKKHVTLPAASTGRYAYGNNDSIYIVVDTDDIDTVGSKRSVVISEVDSVATGIKNVNLVPTAASTDTTTYNGGVSGGVYTLFDKNSYVIAAVVVGENDSASKNYAYVTSSNVELESYDKAADEYTWSREVIINGALTTITYKGDSLAQIGAGNMTQGEWYEVKYYADGTVKTTDQIDFTTNNDKFGDTVEGVATLVNLYDEVLLSDTGYATKLTCIGATLYTDTAVTKGFPVAEDAKVFLGLKVDGSEFDTVNEYSGVKGLEKAIRDLDADNDAGFTAGAVEINAIIENGVATTVILNDKTGTTTNTGSDTTGNKNVKAIALTNAGVVTVYTDTNKTTVATEEVDVALYQLRDNGYIQVGTYAVTGSLDLSAKMKSGETYKVVCGAYSDEIVKA